MEGVIRRRARARKSIYWEMRGGGASNRTMPPIFAKVSWIVVASATLAVASPAKAAIQWKGFSWHVTDGGMAGVADGDPANVTIDAAGRLHLSVKTDGATWTAAEVFTTQKLGFGTYQWQIEGPVDTFDKQIVLGLFPYGPAAGIGADGTNEIDIEWARWGYADGTNVGFTNYPASGTTKGSKSYKLSLGGSTASTARFTWTSQYIESAVLEGHRSLSSEEGLLAKWKYEPSTPTTNIPQQAMPLGMNLWCFDSPPSDGKNQEIVLVDFQFIEEGDPLPGTGGSGGGTSGGTSSAGAAGSTSGGGGGGSGAGAAQGGGAGGAEPIAEGASGGATSGGSSMAGAISATGGSASSGGSATSGGLPGTSASGSGAAGEATSEGGCSCRLPGTTPSRSGVAFAAALAMALLRRRHGRAAGSGGAPHACA